MIEQSQVLCSMKGEDLILVRRVKIRRLSYFCLFWKKKALSEARFSLALLHNFFCIFQVPRVFIGGAFVGGGDDVQKLQNKGELKPKLEKAGAL